MAHLKMGVLFFREILEHRELGWPAAVRVRLFYLFDSVNSETSRGPEIHFSLAILFDHKSRQSGPAPIGNMP